MSVNRLLLLPVAAVVIWMSILFFVGSRSSGLFAPPLIFVGALLLSHGAYRIGTPDWRSQSWWQTHRLLSYLLGGFSGTSRYDSGRMREYLAASIQVIAAFAFVLGGIAALSS